MPTKQLSYVMHMSYSNFSLVSKHVRQKQNKKHAITCHKLSFSLLFVLLWFARLLAQHQQTDPLLQCCLPSQSRDAVPDEMAVDACVYNSNHFLLVGAYSTYHSNCRLKSYWGWALTPRWALTRYFTVQFYS